MMNAKEFLANIFGAGEHCSKCGEDIKHHHAVPLGGVGWALRCDANPPPVRRRKVLFHPDPRAPLRLEVGF